MLSKDERRELLNKLYEIIYPPLMKEETRGYNAHTRAQLISEEMVKEMEHWISRQDSGDGSKECP